MVLTTRLLERFKRRKAALRNPFAPIFRLVHAGTGSQSIADACTHGLELPYKAGEFGKGLDFVGTVRPSCKTPWCFPPGEHQVLVCDVAVGISWRVPDGTAQLHGEWDEEAAGIGYDYLHEWAVSSVGCEELGGKGWFKLKAGGFAECRQELTAGDTLCCSFRFKEPVLANEVGANKSGTSLWASCFVQRGVYGSDNYARFGFAITSGGHVVLVHEDGASGRGAEACVPSHHARTSLKPDKAKRGRSVAVAQLEEREWCACEIRLGSEAAGQPACGLVGLKLLAGRSDGGAGSDREASRGLCSHQSQLLGAVGVGGGGWTAAVQLEGAGEMELDDWVVRHCVARKEQVEVDSENVGSVVGLDGVRRAGYDSVFVPREVGCLDAATRRLEEEVRQRPSKALELAKVRLPLSLNERRTDWMVCCGSLVFELLCCQRATSCGCW